MFMVQQVDSSSGSCFPTGFDEESDRMEEVQWLTSNDLSSWTEKSVTFVRTNFIGVKRLRDAVYPVPSGRSTLEWIGSADDNDSFK